MKYCNECGAPLTHEIPSGDNRLRLVCTVCGHIHYQNPKIVAGCIPQWEDKILLCRRAIQPRHGLWTLPAGFMENTESAEQAALRETDEEAGARVRLDALFALISIPHISQVYIMFRGGLQNLDFAPGPESLETVLFAEHEIPWQELAFPVMRLILTRFFADRAQGHFCLHVEDMHKHRSPPATP